MPPRKKKKAGGVGNGAKTLKLSSSSSSKSDLPTNLQTTSALSTETLVSLALGSTPCTPEALSALIEHCESYKKILSCDAYVLAESDQRSTISVQDVTLAGKFLGCRHYERDAMAKSGLLMVAQNANAQPLPTIPLSHYNHSDLIVLPKKNFTSAGYGLVLTPKTNEKGADKDKDKDKDKEKNTNKQELDIKKDRGKSPCPPAAVTSVKKRKLDASKEWDEEGGEESSSAKRARTK